MIISLFILFGALGYAQSTYATPTSDTEFSNGIAEGTLVATPFGEVPIEILKRGDEVFSYDDSTPV